MIPFQEIAQRILSIREGIDRAAEGAGRNPEDVSLMAVTKTQPPEAMIEAGKAGIRLFGENRVQEAAKKIDACPPGGELHLIGPLQSNKAARAAELFGWIDAVDRMKILRRLADAAEGLEKRIGIMLEINSSGEESKHGFSSWEELEPALDLLQGQGRLELTGLMTLGPLGGDEETQRRAFRLTREFFERVRREYSFPRFSQLSMGMSGDYPLAVQEGSTLVRVGTGIFGGRGDFS